MISKPQHPVSVPPRTLLSRRADGEHYTSSSNVLKVLGPLFLDDFNAKATSLISDPRTTFSEFEKFQNELSSAMFLDPASGTGNFLVAAYCEVRRIEASLLQEAEKRDYPLIPKVTLAQFHGIEKNEHPYHQSKNILLEAQQQANAHLQTITTTPTHLLDTTQPQIRHANALTINWGDENGVPDAPHTFVFGNPPFLGKNLQTAEQQTLIKQAWAELGTTTVSMADLVTAWIAKSVTFLNDRNGTFAYVTTNSIAQGTNVPLVFGTLDKHGWRPFFAYQPFEWDDEAKVHCCIVGFSRDDESQRLWLFDKETQQHVQAPLTQGINPYLTDGEHIIVQPRKTPLSPELPQLVLGSMAASGNTLDPKKNTPKPEHDPVAMKYVRRFVSAKELINGTDRWCYWIEDTNVGDIDLSPVLQEVTENCKQHRLKSKKKATRNKATTPHKFADARTQPTTNYLCIPRTFSQNRPYFTADYLTPDVVAGDGTYTAIDPDGFAFAIVSSSMFKTWQSVTGGRMKSDNRFAKELVWNTFPLPALTHEQRQSIIDAGKQVLTARKQQPDVSLDTQYKNMTPELMQAHGALDTAVNKVFGLSSVSNESKMQEALFNTYVTMILNFEGVSPSPQHVL